jgi:hypothetical protein
MLFRYYDHEITLEKSNDVIDTVYIHTFIVSRQDVNDTKQFIRALIYETALTVGR